MYCNTRAQPYMYVAIKRYNHEKVTVLVWIGNAHSKAMPTEQI